MNELHYNNHISLETLIEGYRAGFKLVPLSKDARTPNVTGLLTSDEEIRSREESSDNQIHPVNFIYNHPEFWTEDRIKQEHWRFDNVATAFGKTHLTDEQGASLYLNGLDIDSKQVFDSLAIITFGDKDRYFIDEMHKTTHVTQTRKKWGRHIYWLSHKQYKPVRARDCKVGYEFEIKTDNSGLCTLPNSTHRDDPSFHYQSVGRIVISIQDGLYSGLLRELSSCLRRNRTPDEQGTNGTCSTNIVNDNHNISLAGTDVEEIVSQLSPLYQKSVRDNLVYGLSGFLYKNNVKLESAEIIINLLCQSTNDEEGSNRITVLRNTYHKGNNGSPISAYSSLIDILTRSSDEHNARITLESISCILTKYRNPIFSQLDNTIVQELSKYSFEITCYSPLNFVIAHSQKKQILGGTINSTRPTDDNENSKPIQLVQYRNIIIDAVPIRVTKYENPAAIETKYEIEFETPRGQTLKIEPKTIEGILSELRSKGLVYKLRIADEAFPAILNAYERDRKMIIKREIETPGFYMIDDKVQAFKTDHNQPTSEDLRHCALFLNDLVTRFKRKEVISIFIRWGVIAPFSFVMKQSDLDENWLPWIYAYHQTNTGKTTCGRIVLAIWRKHRDKKKHDIGFASADNVARFGRAISYNTFPVLINEVHPDENNPKDKSIIECVKHAVQNQTARSRLSDRTNSEYISALSPCIFTGNPSPPSDPAFRRRFILIDFSNEDQPTKVDIEEFQVLLANNINKLGTLGDFAANYVLNNNNVLRNYWKEASKIILTEFYKAADVDIPEWIDYFVPEVDHASDQEEEQTQVIRAFFINEVNNSFSRHYRTLKSYDDTQEDQILNNTKFLNRLLFCIDNDLIPFLKRKKDGEIVIMQSVLLDLKKQRINHVSALSELARMLQGEVKPVKLNGKTVRLLVLSFNSLVDFLACEAEVEPMIN